jgi:hypothetical protein
LLRRRAEVAASARAFTYGVDDSGTTNDFGQAAQFRQRTSCPSPNGPKTTYGSAILR